MSKARSANTNTKLNDVVDDKWRYQCPECECETIIVRSFAGHERQHLEVELTMLDPRQNNTVKQYRCHSCSSTFDRPYDKKTKERTRV